MTSKMIPEKKKLIIFPLAVLFLAGCFFYFSNQVYYSHGTAEKAVTFEIQKGENAWEVGKKAEEAGIIKSQFYFVYYLWRESLVHNLMAGKYEIASSLSIPEIAVLTTRGEKESAQIKITFPEGWNISEMAERLQKNGFSKEEFLKFSQNPPQEIRDEFNFLPKSGSLEGYLFPDTYYFAKDAKTENIIAKMLENFNLKLNKELRGEISRQEKDIHEIVKMASIIEGEVRTQEDRKIVSGIFWKRIESGRPLQSCATLAYVLGVNKKQYSYDDTRVESPYNTYLNVGLPPGPISNPGLESIKASVYPTKTNFEYFLSDSETGKTVFSKTIDEHNLNKVKFGL